VHYKWVGKGSGSFSLSPVPKASGARGVDLGESVSAKVLSYDPTDDDNFDLHVQIMDGPHAGETGWMLTEGAQGEDGVPIDIFDGAVISISK
jgi:hypothetical protein